MLMLSLLGLPGVLSFGSEEVAQIRRLKSTTLGLLFDDLQIPVRGLSGCLFLDPIQLDWSI
jgi:hypothetical protein